jgi:predicted dehydrogenase
MSDEGREIRVGVIGYGLGGSVFHAPLVAAVPGMRLAAVVTSDAGRAEQARREHPGVEVVPSAEALWERADGLDLAVVSSPNRTHVPLARAAMEAGLGVVIDKPMAATAQEGRGLIDEARRRGLLLSVFQNRRWDGDFLTLRRLLADGALGDVHRFESRFERWRPTPNPGWKESAAPEDAGGTLYDLGSHLIDQALVLFGPAADVYAEVERRRPGVVVEDDVFVALTHASGVRSHLWTSAAAAQVGPRFRVLGGRAAFVKVGLDVQEEMLRGGARPGDPGFGEEPRERWGRIGAEKELTPVPTERGAYVDYYAGIAAALRDGAPPPVDPADSVAGLEIIEAARRSSAERAVIRLDAR